MASACRVFSYQNVATEKDAMSNIAAAAQAGGWTIDKNDIAANDELCLHSAGNGSQSLYFSLKLEDGFNNVGKKMLLVHGNTGFDAAAAWDAQPGRFTEKIRLDSRYNKPVWAYKYWTSWTNDYGSTGFWIVPPVAEQLVLVCPTFVMTALRIVTTLTNDSKPIDFSGWIPLLFGAADGGAGETQLNTVVWSGWGSGNAIGLMLSGLYLIHSGTSYANMYGGGSTNYGNIGLLYHGENVEKLPPFLDYGFSTTSTSVLRTSIHTRPYLTERYLVSGAVTADTVACGVTIGSYKGNVSKSVPTYNEALVQNTGTLRNMLVKPILYICSGENIKVAGELPYYAVSMRGLKAKDRFRIGTRTFMALPDTMDSVPTGLAFEVEG